MTVSPSTFHRPFCGTRHALSLPRLPSNPTMLRSRAQITLPCVSRQQVAGLTPRKPSHSRYTRSYNDISLSKMRSRWLSLPGAHKSRRCPAGRDEAETEVEERIDTNAGNGSEQTYSVASSIVGLLLWAAFVGEQILHAICLDCFTTAQTAVHYSSCGAA